MTHVGKGRVRAGHGAADFGAEELPKAEAIRSEEAGRVGVQVAMPDARIRPEQEQDRGPLLEEQDARQERVGEERPEEATSTLSRYASSDQQQRRSNAVVRAEPMQHTALGEGLNIISRRAFQFTMRADAIESSDEVTLAELAVQLHAPVPKLRMWGASWRRLSGQQGDEGMAAAANALE